ncbi:ubiquinone anaerobic biosynthesis accessory factor UbiT [Celeribacter indicus]|uniref:SCP2 domain-containing protein n=1 Tax=Celeribacter indicus TaxID=1208324 RepID=A0A0B5DXY5_9RHOB|nr:SCP2 sterol-binding domain-containing protein [Celeribacter indicus]AJE45082.1 hypothetical protein P73_0367 [Celeribacter indicus]SDX42829.1 Predicted lipid carrier protein YhbT, contains SCP2 domain [Celeribacter indicus]
MSDTRPSLPRVPRPLAQALALTPPGALSLGLTRYARAVATRHPAMFRRLGAHGQARFLIDPTDLPFALLLEPGGGRPRVTLLRRSAQAQATARIAGSLSALLGLVHGAFDGDALFFSRDLAIEGDTAAVLALRNALDDAELDLSEEIFAFAGPLASGLRPFVGLVERHTGVVLHRPAETLPW